MATLIGDVFADSSRFHNMIGVQRQHSHDQPYQARSVSRSRDRDSHPQQSRPAASPRRQGSANSAAARFSSQGRREQEEAAFETSKECPPEERVVASGGASRIPSPPPSSSPSESSSSSARPQHAIPVSTPSAADHIGAPQQSAFPSSASSTSTDATIVGPPRAMPSPGSDSAAWNPSASSQPSPANRPSSPVQTQTTVHVRDLNHIQLLAKADLLTATGPGILNDPPLQQMKYEISSMPINDIIEMVAALLTKITTTNDLQHDAMNRNANHVRQAARSEEGEGSMSPLSSSVLAFHGKNVPAITILSYLSRIHKYCPTTYEVFLSLLVYFDRMTERVNEMVMKSEDTKRREVEARAHGKPVPSAAGLPVSKDADTVMRDDGSEPSDETDSDLADDDEREEGEKAGDAAAQATYFVVDSFNIHRLIIAGVTCASKFFSDVFYTNSRYAKVCLPLSSNRRLLTATGWRSPPRRAQPS